MLLYFRRGPQNTILIAIFYRRLTKRNTCRYILNEVDKTQNSYCYTFENGYLYKDVRDRSNNRGRCVYSEKRTRLVTLATTLPDLGATGLRVDREKPYPENVTKAFLRRGRNVSPIITGQISGV